MGTVKLLRSPHLVAFLTFIFWGEQAQQILKIVCILGQYIVCTYNGDVFNLHLATA